VTSGGGTLSTSESGDSGGPATLDQLIALNDEITALVRAGVPLELGLSRAGDDLRGRLGAIARGLGERMGRGERLPDALANSGQAIPELYRAVVEAGIRSGRLASALEGVAAVARGYADARRAVGMALLYPLMVVSLAYGLAVLFVLQLAPRLAAAFESLGLPPLGILDAVVRSGDWVAYWGPIVPALLVGMTLWWLWSGRSVALDAASGGPWLGRIPLIGGMIAGFRHANFAEMLALLVEHRVPLDEAVRLAAGASGDRVLRRSAAVFAEGIRRGEGGESARAVVAGALPPLLAWILTAGHRQGELASALRHAAAGYRRRARARAEILRGALPAALMLAVGAGTVLLYGLLLFVPLTALYQELAIPTP